MGLDIRAKGLNDEDIYGCGYITFRVFRKELVKVYNKRVGYLYDKWINSGMFGDKLTDLELDEINELLSDGIALLLTHSDCDGKITPKESRMIYEDIKDLKMDMQGHNY
jgi:hypothetical protein